MMELLKDKVMLSFIILVLIAVYFDALNHKRLEEQQEKEIHQVIINR